MPEMFSRNASFFKFAVVAGPTGATGGFAGADRAVRFRPSTKHFECEPKTFRLRHRPVTADG